MQEVGHLLSLFRGPEARRPRGLTTDEDMCASLDELVSAKEHFQQSIDVLPCPHNTACQHLPDVEEAIADLQPLREECIKFRAAMAEAEAEL